MSKEEIDEVLNGKFSKSDIEVANDLASFENDIFKDSKKEEDVTGNIKIKPKINFKETLKQKSLVLKAVDLKANIKVNIDEDTIFQANINADMKEALQRSLEKSISSAEIKFTKKF